MYRGRKNKEGVKLINQPKVITTYCALEDLFNFGSYFIMLSERNRVDKVLNSVPVLECHQTVQCSQVKSHLHGQLVALLQVVHFF